MTAKSSSATANTYGIYTGGNILIDTTGNVTLDCSGCATANSYGLRADGRFDASILYSIVNLVKTGALVCKWSNSGGTVYERADYPKPSGGYMLYEEEDFDVTDGDHTKTWTWKSGMMYPVAYNLNGGTGTVPTESSKSAGATFTAASSAGLAAPPDKKFKEWNTSPAGVGAGYDPGATVNMPASPLTLYAVWVDFDLPAETIVEMEEILIILAMDMSKNYKVEYLIDALENMVVKGYPVFKSPYGASDLPDFMEDMMKTDPEVGPLYGEVTNFFDGADYWVAYYGNEENLVIAVENGGFEQYVREVMALFISKAQDLADLYTDKYFLPEAIVYANAFIDMTALNSDMDMALMTGAITEEEAEAIMDEVMTEAAKIDGFDDVEDMLAAGGGRRGSRYFTRFYFSSEGNFDQI